MQYKTLTMMLVITAGLSACNQQNHEKVEIKSAPKLTNDATAYAKQGWQLMNKVEPLVKPDNTNLEAQVRKPIRELSTNWRINVKMTDSVAEGKYALCRKALNDLDTWSHAIDDKTAYSTYLMDKAQCKDALDHPELGNSQ